MISKLDCELTTCAKSWSACLPSALMAVLPDGNSNCASNYVDLSVALFDGQPLVCKSEQSLFQLGRKASAAASREARRPSNSWMRWERSASSASR